MQRRDFLKTLIGAAVGVAVAPHLSFDALAEPEIVAPVVTAHYGGIRGLPYILDKSGTYFGKIRNSPPPLIASTEASTRPLMKCDVENAKRHFLQRINEVS